MRRWYTGTLATPMVAVRSSIMRSPVQRGKGLTALRRRRRASLVQRQPQVQQRVVRHAALSPHSWLAPLPPPPRAPSSAAPHVESRWSVLPASVAAVPAPPTARLDVVNVSQRGTG